MIRGDITEELEYLEGIATSLGELMIKAQSLPLTVDDISSWKQELYTLVLGTDQLDLHARLMAGNTFGDLAPDNCGDYLRHYIGLIVSMREQLYHLKSINRSAQSRQQGLEFGNYRILVGGGILFRNKEITFGGKLKAILVAFLVGNDEHILMAVEIAREWGDNNTAAVSRHKCKLDEALAPYYGDGHKHVNRVRTNPTAYKLDIE